MHMHGVVCFPMQKTNGKVDTLQYGVFNKEFSNNIL
jgi:hypothetical protein